MPCRLVVQQGCLDKMERPTSALQGAGYAVRAPLNAEPHTKEAGRDEVYYHHWVRSARRDDGRGSLVAGPADTGAPCPLVGHSNRCAIRRTRPSPRARGLLLRGGPLWL